ncbi:MAG: penicillin-binding protein activator [Candidatus Zixiibacteriota bacterium]
MNLIATIGSRHQAVRGRTRRRAGSVACRLALLIALFTPIGLSPAGAAIPGGGAIKTRDEFVRRRFEKAVELYSEGRLAEAKSAFDRLLEEETLSSTGREVVSFMIGKTFYALSQYDSCQQHFNRFLEALPHSAYRGGARLYIGHCLYQKNKRLAAAQSYAAAVEAGPQSTADVAMSNLTPLIERGLSTTELDSLAAGLDADSPSGDVLLMIAERFQTLGRGRRAETLFRRLAEESRKSPAGRQAAIHLEELDRARRSIAVIGVLAPLSGDYADYGRELEEGIKLAVELYGDQARVHFADDHGDSAGAAAAARLLLTKGCNAIIGPLVPEAIHASARVLGEHEIVQVLPLARRGDYVSLSPHLHQLSNSPRRQARRLAEYAIRTEGMKRLAVFAPDTPEGRLVAEVFSTTALASGVFVHEPALFEAGQTDFGDVLSEWRLTDIRFTCDTAGIDYASLTEDDAELITPSLDGVLIWGEPEDLLLIVPQVRFHGFRPQYLGSPSWEETELLGRIRTVLDSAIFTSDEVPDTTRTSWKQFRTQYRERWRANPTALSARGYDLIRWFLGDDRDDRSASSIAARLTESGGFQGVGGPISLGSDRRPAGVPVYRFREGAPVRVSDD